MLFSIFACLYWTCLYINGLSMHSPYYSIPIWCVSDLFWPFFSLYLSSHLSMFWCFGYFWLLIGFTDSDVTIPSDSDPYGLLVISEPSDVTITYTLPTTPIKKREILCTLLRRPRKTSYCFDLTQTAFPCIIRPRISYIDLDTLCSISFYCVLLIILCFSLRFISFAPISFDLLLPTSDYVYRHTHSFTYPYPISIEPDIIPFTPFYRTFATGTDLPGLSHF